MYPYAMPETSKIAVSALSFYPIKGCGAVAEDEVSFSYLGIKYDREWMLIGTRGQFLSQRVHPELALVQIRIQDDKLIAAAPGMEELAVPLERDPDAEEVPITLWKKPGTGRDQGSDANGYFSEYLGRPARLMRIDEPRFIKAECRVPGAAEQMAFADASPILLASMASLAAFNEHLERPVTIDRFRPNIVVEAASAYDEDYWRELRVGDLRAFVVRPCARCPVPDIDQGVGELPPRERRAVSAALEETRRGIDLIDGDGGEFFGQHLVHVFEPGMSVRRGDPVEVVERAAERNFKPAM